MENSIIDLFADSANIAPGTQAKKETPKSESKTSSFKSTAMMEAMGLISNPKKLKGIVAILIILLIIGFVSTVAFFVIYPICALYAIGSYIVIASGGKIIKLIPKVRE